MKRLFLASAALFILIALAKGQSNEGRNNGEQYPWRRETKKQKANEIISLANDKFNEEFGTVPNVKWKRKAFLYRASFKKGGEHFKVFYDERAKQVGSISHKSFHDLPFNAQQYISSTYTGFKKTKVIYFDDNELNKTDMIMYGKQFEDVDSYFVELKKGFRKIVLQITTTVEVSFFKQLK